MYIDQITCVDANVFRADNKPVTVDINITVRLDDGEHSVSITWDPRTDDVSLERI